MVLIPYQRCPKLPTVAVRFLNFRILWLACTNGSEYSLDCPMITPAAIPIQPKMKFLAVVNPKSKESKKLRGHLQRLTIHPAKRTEQSSCGVILGADNEKAQHDSTIQDAITWELKKLFVTACCLSNIKCRCPYEQ